MAKKRNPVKSVSSHRVTPKTARPDIRDHYQYLQQQWADSIDSADWQRMFDIHHELVDLERRSPWLTGAK